MSMTYRQIQDAVIASGFDESDRSDVKNWIAFRHAWLWDLEQWTFKYPDPVTVTFTANSQTVASVPSDFHAVIALYDANGNPLQPIRDFRNFFDTYNANALSGSTVPEAYTVINSTLKVGPKGDGSSGLLVYEKSKPTLTNDSDPTGLPEGYDLALVHGAKAEGFKLGIVPELAASFDEDFTAAANALRRNYLVGVRGGGEQMGSFRADVWR